MKIFLRGSLIIVLFLCISNLLKAQTPVANFSANITTSCAPAIVAFTDLSTGSPTTWNWNLGNGTNATIQHPTTTYITPGTYTVTLTASNANGSNTKTMVSYITITPTPSIAFTSPDTVISCVPKTVRFINQTNPNSSTGTVTYSWDFGDGSTSTLANPTHIYTSPGIYHVTLVAVNGVGCTSVLTKNTYINAAPKPVASFTSTNNNSCTAPVTASFTNTSTGTTSYLWDFGDGTTSPQASPNHTYTSSGAYTVKLIALSATGCHDTIIKPALVNIGNLTANFTLSTSAACANVPISFTNTTTPVAGNIRWYFGDGDTSSQANPVHRYTAPGTYSVKLVSSFSSCADSVTKTVVIHPGPILQFTATNNLSCVVPATVTFNNASSGGASYLWLFGDGATSSVAAPTHTYTTAGQYTVKLISTNSQGCTDTLVKTTFVQVGPLTGSIGEVLNTPGCAPAGITARANVNSAVPIISYQWDFGDGTFGSGPLVYHTYTAGGNYTINLTVTTSAGCTLQSSVWVTVGTHSSPSFTANPTNVCAGQPVTFTNTTTGPAGITYTWIMGDGGTSTQTNPVYPYNGVGTFTPMLISNTFGCLDTFRRVNYITVTPPLAKYSFNVSCVNRKSVTFTNTSIGATSWIWDFGDGTTYNGQNPPVHQYAANGSYTVTLTVSNGTCTHVKTETIKIFDLVAAFTATPNPVCSGTPIHFDAVEDSSISAYTWNFGDGITLVSSKDTVTHLYASTGIYTPVLMVRDIYNCTDSVRKPNHIKINGINPLFVANNTHSCGQATVTFTDQSTSISSIVARTWNFGDSTIVTTTGTTISHTYARSGIYNVRLHLTDSIGCQNELTKIAYITVTKPDAVFTSTDTNICQNRPVVFTNRSTGVAPITYSWDFGDGATSTVANPSHVYASSGNYTVKLIATDANGCKDTLTRTSYIHINLITAAFTMSDSLGACPPFTVNFNNISSGATSYQWNFGNGNTSTSANPSNVFVQPATYTVTLKAFNAGGCMDSMQKTVRVNSGPAGTFTYTPIAGCFPMTVHFTSANTNTTAITFDFNNGITHTTSASSYSYTYTQPGNYLPVLVLSNSAGCNTSVVGPDTIRIAKVYAGFKATPDTICLGSAINFTDTSRSVATTINSYNWNFGDGNTATGSAAAHTYTTAGTYRVRLIVGGTSGCKDTAYHTVLVQTFPVLTAADKIICAGGSVTMSVSGASTYSWTPATGLSCTNCANPIASPTTTTTYTITGIATGGCSSTKQVTVSVNPVPLTLNANGATICEGASALLNATGAATYQWTPAIGLSCTNCATPQATPTTTITYTLTGTSASGCSNSIPVTVNVNPKPLISAASQQICAGGSTSLSANGANTYVWSPATGLSCTNCANPTATPSATATYTVTGTNANGCSNTALATVTVIPNPVITVSGNTSNCLGTGASLSANGAATYAWTPATGLSCTNCANPIATPTTTTTYTVTGTINAGCIGSTTTTVTVHQPPTVTAGNDVSTCSGTAVTLNAGGAATYRWSPATGLSCTTCPNPVANPTTTTAYTVTGTDAFGCTNTAAVTVQVLPKPTITTSNQMICAGGSVSLSANGGTTYIWSPATALSCTNCPNPIASPATTTTYTVAGTDANGCTNTAQSIVTVTTNPVITVSGNTVNCLGTGASLTASGAVAYAWTPATGLSCTNCANPVATPTTTTTYTVTGTISAGCTGTTTTTVTVRQPPNVSAGTNVSTCSGTATTLNASGAATYNWTPATGLSCTNCASPSANPTATTTYTVTGTDAFGCRDTGMITVTVLPRPVITTSNQSICAGGTAVLSANGGTNYVWSPGTGLNCTNCPSPEATPTATTNYTVTGTGTNGCTNTAQSLVTVNPIPVIAVNGNLVICPGAGTSLTASGAATYAWTPATGLSCANCANPTATPETTTTYTITGTSAAGCVGRAMVTVTVRPAPVVTAGSDQSTCLGTPVSLAANGATTYVWTPATGLSCTACQSPAANPTATTTYIVTGTDGFGCKDTGRVTVAIKPLPAIRATRDTSICKLTSVQLDATGGTNYTWSPATGLSCTNCPDPVATPTANITYTVTGTGTNGCLNTAQVTVTQRQQPPVNAGPDQTICAGKNASLTATGASTYVWSPAASLSCSNCANTIAMPSLTTTYQVTGTDIYGCIDSDKVAVTVILREPVSIGKGGEICAGESFSLSATGGSDYSWYPAGQLNNSSSPAPIATPGTTTAYRVVIRQGYCFADTLSATVVVHPLPTVDAGPDKNITGGSSTQLQPTGTDITTYLWTPADGLSCTTCANPIAGPQKTTTYTVNVTSEFGCQAKDDVTLFINCEGKQVWLPNTFTPNGDGHNDRFYPHGRGIDRVLRFRIYNRWGEVLYDRANVPTDDASYGWDGLYKNQQLKPDVYVYVILAQCANGDTVELKGDISLIR
jgi:gliding motility-associated-like protein